MVTQSVVVPRPLSLDSAFYTKSHLRRFSRSYTLMKVTENMAATLPDGDFANEDVLVNQKGKKSSTSKASRSSKFKVIYSISLV